MVFSTEQLVERWEFRRRIQNIMGIYSQHILLKMERNIFEDLWSCASDVCLGLNDGYFLGQDAVSDYYEGLHQRNLLTAKLLKNRFPDKFQGKSDDAIYGAGMMDYTPLDSPVIEIAADNKTAKGIWACRNTYSILTSGGPESFFVWGWYAVDFIYEDGDWKIWHLLHVNDAKVKCGAKLSDLYEPYPVLPEFSQMSDFHMLKPTVESTVREHYHTKRPFRQPPQLPEPYDTFKNTFSYAYVGKE